ncbi:MAG: peptide ABC transporter substrate-binding protein [Candidatus Hydrogenedentes bacterium]|nr:peptide ABC transporter substrate-binding protein [Candidatus Hydrogenedentota bacterium]
MNRLLVFALALAGCVALAAGCGGGATDDGKKVLRVGNRSEVQDLDPHLCTGVAEQRALASIFQGLADLDLATMKPIPGAAASWTISEDGLVYTFALQPNGKWSNGDPVVAGDFLYAYKRMLTPALGSEYAYMLHCLKNAKAYNEGTLTDFGQVGVKVVDDATLELTLEAPTPYFLSMQIHYSWFPVPQKAIEAFGEMTTRGSEWTRPGNHVGNGPFKLKDWRPDEVLAVERNPNYWNAGSVKLDEVQFYPISNEQTEERMFRNGELDLTYTVPMFKIESYRKEHPELLQIHPYLGSYFYRFNLTRKPFDDVRVRQAFSLALNREEIAANVCKAGEQPAHFFTPPNTAGYTSQHQVETNIEKAKALLAEAGYPNGQGLPPVEILYNSSETDKIFAETVQNMWQGSLGATITLRNQDYKIYLDSMTGLNYDIARSMWIGDVVDPVNFLECFLTGGGNNRTGFASPEFDAAIRAAYAEPDVAKREAHLQSAEKILLENAVIAPVFFYTQKFLQDPKVKNVVPNLLGQYAWQDIDIVEPAA